MLEPKGLEVTTFGSSTDLLPACEQRPPAVLLLDLGFVAGPGELEGFLGQLFGRCSTRPWVICIASRERGEDSMERRLLAMRAGVDSYILSPVSPRRLISRVLRMCGIVDSSRYRILVLENDPEQSKKIAILIASAGMEALVLDDPMRLLDRMLAFRPNLILMNPELPEASGAELAASIRDHDDFFGIPILFLSAERDLVKQLEALKAGGDGFITKPVRRTQLITAIERRICMSRWLQDRRTMDNRRESAHGFLPRDVFLRYLDRMIDAGEVQDDSHGLLVIELDDQQRAQEALGIGGTERLLRQMEMQLSRLMLPEDSATRLDDFRYGVLAKRENGKLLRELGSELCALLSEVGFQEQLKDLKTTVSVGIGLFVPPANDAEALVARGLQAVSSAKAAGGNQSRLFAVALPPNETPPVALTMVKRLVNAALNHDGLFLLFQPIMPLNQQDEEMYEAQLRLRTLDGEQITPADFLAAADRGGLLAKIDRWVLAKALEVMDRHRATLPRLRFLVHQTVSTLASPDWFPWFRDQIVQRHLVRLYPLLQFQMSDLRNNRADVKPVIDRLRTYGIQICVANVSGEKEDLALLARLGVKFAKLGVQAVNPTEQAKLAEIIHSLQIRGIAVIVAGIDDQETVSRVWNCRPDFIQGNYLQVPREDLRFDFKRPLGGL